MREHRLPAPLAWLGALQARRPWLVLAIGLLSLLPALGGIFCAGGLGFRSEFAELLPDNRPSVVEMRRVSLRLPGATTLTVVADIQGGQNPQALGRFVDALVPRVLALGPDKVGAVDYGVKEAQAFFEANKLLFADLADIEQAHREVTERYDHEVARASGTLLDDGDAPPPLSADSIEQRLRKGEAAPRAGPRYPGGYYMNPEGSRIAALIRTPVGGKARKAAFKAEVEAIVGDLDPASFDPRMTVAYTGAFITSDEEYQAIVGDLMHVGGWGVFGVLLSVFLFFLRVRTLLALGFTIATSLLWTFGLTRLTIGYLNSSTGFLVSIIAGNGINYGIMYMARYLEARRDEGLDVERAILAAHRDSWVPTLAGSATAMLAYGSLILTDFRGFKHFGVISGYGMILCWVATYALMPAALAASERVLPSFGEGARGAGPRLRYGLPFAWLARRFSLPVALAGALACAAGVWATARYFRDDPIEYNMRNIRNERRGRSAASLLNSEVDDLVGRLGQDGMAIMVDRLDQVPALEAELNRRRDAAPADKKPFERVVTIHSLLPRDQERKIALLGEIRDRLERARRRGFLDEASWRRLAPHFPPGPLAPLGVADLPEQAARPFTEKDGTRGRIVYIVPTTGSSVWDARYLMRWADSFRSTTLPGGETVLGSGSAVIHADMIRTIAEDTPKAIAFSALGSVLVILLAFRFDRAAWGVFLPWLLGIGGLVAYLHQSGIKLNFLNFVALPITIGIGAEYAHNMMQRYRAEPPERLYHATVETGGAVILCSLTTTIGYLALTLSINQGIRSFGLAAAVGELTCVLAAVLVLPAALFGLRGVVRGALPVVESHGCERVSGRVWAVCCCRSSSCLARRRPPGRRGQGRRR